MYCWSTGIKPNVEEGIISYVGECNSSSPCNQCKGDCDGSSGCKGDLKCFQRDGYEEVPGCTGAGGIYDVGGKDICYAASTPAPTASSTPAPEASSTLAPVASPIDNCPSLGQLKTQMDNMEDKMDSMDGVLRTILDLMTQGSTPAPSPVPSSAPVTSCVDKQGKFEHNGSKKQWCRLAQNAKNTNKLCKNHDLYDHCPWTCDRCPP